MMSLGLLSDNNCTLGHILSLFPVEVHDRLADAGLLQPRVVVDRHAPQVPQELGPDLDVRQGL